MNNTTTQITATPPAATAAQPPAPRRAERFGLVKIILKPFASLRLTVVLFVLSIFLVFCGTMAQMDNGLWAVLSNYFDTIIAWIPFQVFLRFGQVFFWFPKSWHIAGSFPFPGGKILGGLLIVNLLAAHLVRFRLSWKRAGILITHTGLVLLMLGEVITHSFAVEGIMTIPIGQARNYAQHLDKFELSVIDASDSKKDEVVVIPATMLKQAVGGGRIQDERLPFEVEVIRYFNNSTEPRKVTSRDENPATAGLGLEAIVDEEKPHAGVDPDGPIDLASAYVTFHDKKTGAALGKYLLSSWFDEGVTMSPPEEQPVKVNGKEYKVALRFQRDYKPYTIYLEEFHHDLYPGTDTPKNFSSKIRLIDPQRNEAREVVISMNNPLRYRGAAHYQASWIPGDRGTKLQVVTNPGWLMPYISCTLIILGMTLHFGLYLVNYLRRRTAP